MGRTRSIDRDAVLDAAQEVVRREGAARMTLDAVATEAGISKASVLYDYKTKQALMKAVIERRMAAETARQEAIAAGLADGEDTAIRGSVAAAASRPMSGEDRAVAMNLCAALAQDADLRAPIQERYRGRIAEITRTSRHPRGALLAFLALEGLMTLEWFDLHAWPAAERERLIGEILWLSGQNPAPDSS